MEHSTHGKIVFKGLTKLPKYTASPVKRAHLKSTGVSG